MSKKQFYANLPSFVLMNKNIPVLEFLYDEEVHSIAHIEQVYNEDFAPLGIKEPKVGVTRKALNSWWAARAIPASRNNFSRIMQDLGIQSSVELLEKCSGFSLSDQYWIKPLGKSIEWSNLNFFENDFSEDMGHLLLGQCTVDRCLDLVSPDNASDGDLAKKWKIIDGNRVLVKSGNSLNNQEPYNEVIATRLFERILRPDEYIPYFFIKENGKIYSGCETMVSTCEELVSAFSINNCVKFQNNESSYQHFVSACRDLSIGDPCVMISKMLTCDFIIANYDRHFRNFGAIRNVETLQWERFAPLFDNGSALWATTPTKEISAYKYTSKPFYSDPVEQFNLVSDLRWLEADRLIGFEKEVSSILLQNPHMTDERISIISSHVKDNIRMVLEKKKSLNPSFIIPLDLVIQSCEERQKSELEKVDSSEKRFFERPRTLTHPQSCRKGGNTLWN